MFSSIFIFGFNDIGFHNNIRTNSLLKFDWLGINDTIVNDTIVSDTSKLRYPFNDYKDSYSKQNQNSALYLKNPSNIKTEVDYNPSTGEFLVTDKIGDYNYRSSDLMSFNEFRDFSRRNSISDYWIEQRRLNSGQGGQSFLDKYLNPKLNVNIKGFDRIFGSNVIDIKPQGTAELIFGVNISKIENPTLPINLQRSTTFDFDMKIQMAVTGNIGEKMKVGITYNTEATFDFENQTTISYTGNEDEIIQSIEAGNVSLPLTGTLITGNQSLFGLKTALQFGKLRVTSIFSQQKSETSVIEVEGGAQKSDFEFKAEEYEANRHFFISQYFKDNYDKALKNLPIINSAVIITRIEVWVTNKTGNFENSRNIVGFMDLAENETNTYQQALFAPYGSGLYPSNDLNNLYQLMNTTYSPIRNINQVTSTLAGIPDFAPIIDYAKVENARLLSPNEYDINNKLGYISLKSPLNDDEVLAVAFEYTISGKVYKVGEFSNSGINAPSCLILKLLKSQAQIPNIPTWDLMMKNVYSIGSYQVNSEDFRLDVYYNDDKTGTLINYIDAGSIAGKPLLKVMGLDQVNNQLDPQPDGFFDYIERITINSSNGRIFFPEREPFGSYLRTQINNDIADEYVFEELYDSTQSKARQVAEKSKFLIKGSFKSTGGAEILLNAINIPEGSVKVSANGVELTEGNDFLVDYNLGRVTILNQALLESGTPIKISLESNSMFNINRKTLLGTHLDYIISDNFTLGGTILHLSEKPLTNKVNIGNEPISNTIWGLDGTYTTEFPFLTRLIDKIPFIETKEMSTVEISGEFAQLIPGHSKTIGDQGNAYIDDFEGAKTTIDLKSQYSWVIASTPKGQNDLFPEGELINNLQNGFNRAKFAWYNVNSDLLRNTTATPSHISVNDQSDHLVREVYEKEIFPNKESATGYPTILSIANMAFYPEEKGVYNYDAEGVTGISTGINAEGKLNNPETRWGGIMRRLTTNDFEAANIEFIEFWIMDPFINDENNTHTGGDLYFNLGYLSEDILKDSRKSFENGLPNSSVVTLVDTTTWGRVPLQQSLVNAFDNDPNARQYQDVGMDGLSDNDERTFFSDYLSSISSMYGAGSQAYTIASTDPSSDNYHFFRGTDYDAQNLSILDRYKNFNGLEGNSPTAEQSPEDYPTSATLLPDVEDINLDNTLNEEESYYQYKVSLRPSDMVVGENYITDMIESNVTLKNNEEAKVKWYQFKIPINEPETKIGPISDFRSIRFMRMFMKNFDQEIVARFAKLDLVRSEWRNYSYNLSEGSEAVSYPQDVEDGYDISVVSIEENGSRWPINYVLPPGISRVVDPTNPQLTQLNEQAISFKVVELNDGDARAAYKNVDLDIRQYKRLQMEVHGESLVDEILNDDELTVFIRLGSDYKQNYYEYEIPLKITQPGYYDNDLESAREKVWPRDGRIDFELSILQLVKQHRNNAMRNIGSTVLLSTPFIEYVDNHKVTVVGSPNLSNIKTVMIGVRNPSKQNNPNLDDGLSKSGIIWMNELRMTDFNEEGGWAANARITTKLADFGTVTLSGNASTFGFGSIEQKLNERQKEDIYQYDITSNFELGKFFPSNKRIRIPLYYGVSESFRNPQYNPLDPDILLKTTLSDPEISQNEKDSIRNIVVDYTKRRSFNLTNIKFEGDPEKLKNKKKRFYHISNFSASFAYNELFSRNINTEHDIQKNYNGSIAYVFNNRPKNYEPLKSVKFLKKKYLKLISDFNFYLAPSMISFRTDMNKKFQEVLIRNITEPNSLILPTYKKDFIWNRDYDVKYDITKGLKLQFTANNKSRIDEPYGRIDKNEDDYTVKRDSVFDNILNLGRNVEYNHSFNANYNVPISKIPLLGWTSLNTMYKSTYNWQAGPLQQDDIIIGNNISNSNTIQINGQLNFLKVYNSVPFLKTISDKMKSGVKESNKKYKEVNFNKDAVKLKKDIAKSITHNLKTENVQIDVTDENGNKIDGELIVVNENKVKYRAKDNYSNVSIKITGKRELKENLFRVISEGFVYALMGVKNISISYTETNGTILPGYLPDTKIVGLSSQNNLYSPGYPFILGIQDDNFAKYAAQNGWITTDSLQTSPYQMTHTYNINVKSTLEPLKGLRIDVTAMKNMSNNKNEYWIADAEDVFTLQNKLYTGSFSMTFLAIRTAFEEYGTNYYSKTYENFKLYRKDIAWRLANERNESMLANSPEWNIYDPNFDIEGNELNDGYPNGYGPLSQEVLIPAFLAAYSGGSPKKASLSPFPKIPIPNWRVTYDGLSDIKFIKRLIKSISINHGYSATYNVGAFNTNTSYSWTDKSYDGYSWTKDEINKLFIPQEEISGVTINEQFNPLIGADITWKNNINTRFEYKKGRTLTLSFSNNQLIDMINNEIIIGAGYRIEALPIVLKMKNNQQKFKSDLNLRADFSIMDMLTIIRKLEEAVDQITAGQKAFSLKLSADYALNERFNLRFFYDHAINTPSVSTAFKTSNIKFGFSVRFTLIP
ncbi:MAG: cell surface protein SprA [Bacteroidales bacterium]|nr:cell surface protein SprA [Bacteroidales bacterium]